MGIGSAIKNIRSFSDHINSLQQSLSPVNGLLSAGLFGGVSVAAFGAIGNHFSTVSGTAQKMGQSVNQAASGFQKLSGASSETLNTIITVGAGIGAVSAAIIGTIQGITSLTQITAAIYALDVSIKMTIADHREYATVCSISEAATEMLTASGIKNASVTQIQAASILLMSREEAAAVTQKKLLSVWTKIKSSAIVQETTSTSANVLQTKIQTALETVLAACKGKTTVATVKNTAANVFSSTIKMKDAVVSGICTVANYAMAAAAYVAAGGVLALNGAIAMNPIGAAVIAVLALVAALAGIVYWFSSGKSAAQEYAESMEKVRIQNEKVRKSSDLYTKRLEQLNEKENLSKKEKAEIAQYVEELNKRYKGLNLSVDAMTGKIKNADGAFIDLKKAMSDAAETDLNKEIDALNASLDELQARLGKNGKTGWGRWIGGWLTLGGMDNEKETQKKIEETKKKLHEAETKKLNNAMDRDAGSIEAEKKTAEEKKKIQEELDKKKREANDFIAAQEDEIRKNNQTALQNEIDSVQKAFAEKKAALQTTIQEMEANKQDASAQKDALNKINDLEKQRIDIIKNKYATEEAKKIQQIQEEGLKLQADLEKAIRQENQNAMDKELEALDEMTQKRREQLQLIIDQGKATTETYAELDNLNSLKNQRANQIKGKYAADARKDDDKFFQTKENDRKTRERDQQDADISNRIEDNPFVMVAELKKNVQTANDAVESSYQSVVNARKESMSDGIRTDAEKDKIAQLEKNYQDAIANRNRYEGHLKSAQDKTNERVSNVLGQQGGNSSAGPVDTLMRGSVEAFKQEIANANRAKTESPEVRKFEEVRKQLEKDAQEKTEIQKKTMEYTKKLYEKMGAV